MPSTNNKKICKIISDNEFDFWYLLLQNIIYLDQGNLPFKHVV